MIPPRHNTKATTDLQGRGSGLGALEARAGQCRGKWTGHQGGSVSPFCCITNYETLNKSLLKPSFFFAVKEKISKIMNRKPFVNWQGLNKCGNTRGSSIKQNFCGKLRNLSVWKVIESPGVETGQIRKRSRPNLLPISPGPPFSRAPEDEITGKEGHPAFIETTRHLSCWSQKELL